MNKLPIALTLLLLTLSTYVLSQNLEYPDNHLYYYNYSLVNPAHVGLTNEFSVTTSLATVIDNQNSLYDYNFSSWNGLIENKLSKINSGIGGVINYQKFGAEQYFKIAPIYSYQIEISEDVTISIGARPKYELVIIDYSFYAQIHPDDPLVQNKKEKISAFDLDLGTVVQIKNTTFGVGGRNIFESDFGEFGISQPLQNKFNLTAFLQQEFNMTENLSLIPSLFFISDFNRSDLDVNTIFKIKKILLIGCGLQSVNHANSGLSVSTSAGVNIKDMVQLMTLVYSNFNRRNDLDRTQINVMARVRIKKSERNN